MVSILIVNWNTRDLLRKCLESICAHPPNEECEVIVVDNASSDGSADMVEEFVAGLEGEVAGSAGILPASRGVEFRLVRSTTNSGYAHGNNLAFEAASGDFLLTLNPDTEFVDDSLDRALHVMRVNPDVACLGARQVSPDGSTQASIRGFPTLLGILGDVSGLGRLFPNSKLDGYRLASFDYETEQDAAQPMGTFLLFRRAALESLPLPLREAEGEGSGGGSSGLRPFDDAFPIFFNEVDLLYRLKQKRWRTLYAPSVRILHHGGESTKQVRKSMIWESHRSLVRYLRKHSRGGVLLAPLIYLAAFVRAKGYHAGFQA